jgi:hypothetical protein
MDEQGLEGGAQGFLKAGTGGELLVEQREQRGEEEKQIALREQNERIVAKKIINKINSTSQRIIESGWPWRRASSTSAAVSGVMSKSSSWVSPAPVISRSPTYAPSLGPASSQSPGSTAMAGLSRGMRNSPSRRTRKMRAGLPYRSLNAGT